MKPECCSDPANIDRQRPAADKIIDTCRVCGRNHYRILVKLPTVPAEPKRRMSAKERLSNVARASAWNRANKERRKEIKRRSYAKNRAKVLASTRAWYKRHKEYMAQMKREWQQANPELVIEYAARRRATKLRTATEKITARHLADLWEKQAGKCAYCGKP
jgi:16S rRNA C967 or C1407 C5-methylase (RsmB/RsmF family)